ncbi:HmuY family protein [Faucicola mancuniensis]|uniref:HmuY family protein n=1 Tax=Faucicola mancuniensis TaxID=1309795 RepID=UPI003977C0CF
MNHKLTVLATLLATVGLTACGGGGGGGSSSPTPSNNASNNASNSNGSNTNNGNANNANQTPTATFSDSATWEVDSTKKEAICYDFDSKTEVGCDSTIWDFKFDNTTGRTPTFWTNGGTSGTGKGASLGLFDWSELKTYTNATIDPKSKQNIAQRYILDSTAGIFTTQSWYQYNMDTHQLAPNNRVYLITTDNTSANTTSSVQAPIFALQVINYYNESATSGYPTLRWIDTATPNDVKTQMFNASSQTEWTYINLSTSQTTTADGNWHIALQRDKIKLNGGTSGKGKVAGFLAKQPTGYYDDKGEAIAEKFNQNNIQESLADLQNTQKYRLPTSARAWVSDSFSSPLNPAYTGTFPNIDYQWYTYNGTNHKLTAKPEDTAKGVLLRSAEGDSYARMRLAEIKYATSEALLPTSWVFEFGIQPK